MRLADVSPVTEVSKLYVERLDAAIEKGAQEFYEVMAEWRELCPDAYDAANAEGFQFAHLKDAWAMERMGRFSGEDSARRFGAIILPAALMHAQMTAMEFHVPDGLALRRLVEVGRLEKRDGGYREAHDAR